jgi:ferredoxin
MEPKYLSHSSLNGMVADLLAKGYIVMSESPEGKGLHAVRAGEDVRIDTTRRPQKISFKDVVHPKTDVLFYFRKTADDVRLLDPPSPDTPVVILGARACDARSISILAKLFNWDYEDAFFNIRAENTVIIGAPCRYSDEHCFCTSVGLDPSLSDSSDHADAHLIPMQDGGYTLRAVTPKGEAFVQAQAAHCSAMPSGATAQPSAAPPRRFEAAAARQWLAGHFEHPAWAQFGETCLGCAQCAYVCPTCHCFDIVDEQNSYIEGRRMKNWDACQFGLFTRHASGHNPRENQSKRYRQRISHKFQYYPERFGEVLCTGCGRCSRGCPVGMDIADVIETLMKNS